MRRGKSFVARVLARLRFDAPLHGVGLRTGKAMTLCVDRVYNRGFGTSGAQRSQSTMASVEQRYDEAIELQQQGKLEEAVAKLEELRGESPDYALAHSALSVYYGKLGRHDEAVTEAKRVCELEPDDSFSFMSMSLICQRAGRMHEAEQALGMAMEKQWAARRAQ